MLLLSMFVRTFLPPKIPAQFSRNPWHTFLLTNVLLQVRSNPSPSSILWMNFLRCQQLAQHPSPLLAVAAANGMELYFEMIWLDSSFLRRLRQRWNTVRNTNAIDDLNAVFGGTTEFVNEKVDETKTCDSNVASMEFGILG